MDQQRMNPVSAVAWLLAGPAALLGALVFLTQAPPFGEAWLGALVLVAAWSLAAWGACWTLMCLLGLAAALPRRRGLASHPSTPRWADRLPRRAMLSAALASSLMAAAVAPAHAAGALPTGGTTQVAAATHQGAGATGQDAGWPVTPEDPRPSGTKQPGTGRQASTDGYTAQRSAQDLPRALGSPGRDTVLVRRGDTLWDIAARHLGPSATSADIAHEWPLWYQANREEIGADPDLLLPGQVLHPPR